MSTEIQKQNNLPTLAELWKDITDYEGLYQISNLGRIRSLDRIRINGKNSFQIQKGRILKLVPHYKNKYLNVMVCVNNKRKLLSVHRIVAQTFIPNPNNLREVNHIDRDKNNNSVENLEWVTPLQNRIHASTFTKFKADKPIKRYDLSGNELGFYPSIKQCAREIGSNPRNIHYCLSGKAKTHKQSIFKYA